MGACVKAASDEGSVLGELACERWAGRFLGRALFLCAVCSAFADDPRSEKRAQSGRHVKANAGDNKKEKQSTASEEKVRRVEWG